MSKFRAVISRADRDQLASELIGCPTTGQHIIMIRVGVMAVEVDTIAYDDMGRPFLDDRGNVATHTHSIRVAG